MSPKEIQDTALALGRIPSGLFVMTTAHEGKRRGVRVTWVQQCGFDPPLVSVALAKGHCMAPLLQDSRSFALSQLAEEDRVSFRRFEAAPAAGDDEFEDIETIALVTGAPALKRSVAALDCLIVRHLDLDSDHELYVGQVVAGRVSGGSPAIRLRGDGLSY